MKTKTNKKLGFTLVEMLVVISIIGILSAVLAGGYVNSQKSSRDAARKLSLKSISDALNSYYADNGIFPIDSGTTGITNLINTQGQLSLASPNEIIYIKKMPKETTTRISQIKYQVLATRKSFRLYTNLENDEDKNCIKDSLGVVLKTINSNYYLVNTGCIYIVTSSNVGTTGTLL